MKNGNSFVTIEGAIEGSSESPTVKCWESDAFGATTGWGVILSELRLVGESAMPQESKVRTRHKICRVEWPNESGSYVWCGCFFPACYALGLWSACTHSRGDSADLQLPAASVEQSGDHTEVHRARLVLDKGKVGTIHLSACTSTGIGRFQESSIFPVRRQHASAQPLEHPSRPKGCDCSNGTLGSARRADEGLLLASTPHGNPE